LAPCSANPSGTARRHGITRSNAAHSARTNPNIEPSEQTAATAIHPGWAAANRSRTSSTPGNVASSATATPMTTTKKPTRRTMPRTSSSVVSGAAIA
jgi:hypothetical protein